MTSYTRHMISSRCQPQGPSSTAMPSVTGVYGSCPVALSGALQDEIYLTHITVHVLSSTLPYSPIGKQEMLGVRMKEPPARNYTVQYPLTQEPIPAYQPFTLATLRQHIHHQVRIKARTYQGECGDLIEN